MEQGWDPDVKKYFVRILNTISIGLFWMMASVTAGIYFKLGYRTDRPLIWVILFYIILVASLAGLIRYFYKIWKN